jgi:CBS domain-containing protein
MIPCCAQCAKAFSHGRHRAAIVDTDHESRVVGIVTSFDVLRLINDNIGVIGTLADAAVGRLFRTGADVVTSTNLSTPARACFRNLAKRNHTGMPVCDDEGKIIGNISSSDIRVLATNSREECEALLDKPVGTFLSFVGRGGADAAAIRAPITVFPTDSLETVIRLLVASKVHRVYIVDSARRPIGIISVTDIIRVLLAPTINAWDMPVSEDASATDATSASATAISPTNTDLALFLHSITASDFLGRSGIKFDGIVDIDADQPASAVLELLERHRISGVAVYVEEAVPMTGVYGYGGPGFVGAYVPMKEKKYVGWVDAAGSLLCVVALRVTCITVIFECCRRCGAVVGPWAQG